MDTEHNKMMDNISLWICLNKCGNNFNTEFLLSIIEKYDENGVLTENQYNSVKNIYEKCNIVDKMNFYSLVPYNAVYIKNLEVEEILECDGCKCVLDEWILEPNDIKYENLYCVSCFNTSFNNKDKKEDKPKRKYKRRINKTI